MLHGSLAALAGLLLGIPALDQPLGVALRLAGCALLVVAVRGHVIGDLARGLLLGLLWYGTSLLWFPTTWARFDSVGAPWLAYAGLVLLQAVVPAVGLGLAGGLKQIGVHPVLCLLLALPAAEALAPWVQPLPAGLPVYLAPAQPLLWPAAWLGVSGWLALLGGWIGLLPTRPASAMLVLATWAGIGWLAPAPTPDEVLRVALVQPDTGALDGRRSSTADARAERLVALLRRAASDGARLLLTPETAWPHPVGPPGSHREGVLLDALEGLPPVVVGASVDDGALPTNSLLLVQDGRIAGRQDKVDLLPLGERALWGLGRDSYRAGSSRTLLHGPARLAGRICYEDLVPGALRGLGHAELLLTPSNDVWLGPGAGSHTHEAGSRLAAVLTGRWVVRATTNGRSAVFDPAGHRLVQLDWVDGDDQDSPGQLAVIDVGRVVPLWTGADLDPWLQAGLCAWLGALALNAARRRRENVGAAS